MAIDIFFSALHWLGATIYGGSLIAFSLLLVIRQRIVGEHRQNVMGVFLAWGPGLGLSMGALILGGAVTHFRIHGAFEWPTETLPQQLIVAQHLVLLVLWVSSFHLEIWTLDPVRKLEGPTGTQEHDNYEKACASATRQAFFNALLFLTCGALGFFATQLA